MKTKKIKPLIKATLSPEELLADKGMTKDEWNDMLKRQIDNIKADDSLSKQQKENAIAQLWGMMIVERDGELKFAIEVVANAMSGGGDEISG